MFYDREYFATHRPVLVPLAAPVVPSAGSVDDVIDYVIDPRESDGRNVWLQVPDGSGVYLEFDRLPPPPPPRRPALSTDFCGRHPLRARLVGADDRRVNDCVYSAQAKFDAPLVFTPTAWWADPRNADERIVVNAIDEESLTYYETRFASLPFDSATATLSDDGRSRLVAPVEVCVRGEERRTATAKLTLAADTYTVHGLKIRLTQSVSASLGELTISGPIVPSRSVHRVSWYLSVSSDDTQEAYSVHVAFSRQLFPVLPQYAPAWTMEVSCADRIDGTVFYDIYSTLLDHYAHQYTHRSRVITPGHTPGQPFDRDAELDLNAALLDGDGRAEGAVAATPHPAGPSESCADRAFEETSEWLHELVRYMGLETIVEHAFVTGSEERFRVGTTVPFKRLRVMPKVHVHRS